ncbi:MAG: hypothetical protein AAF085_17595, partial [Planctomycetota bacterium]
LDLPTLSAFKAWCREEKKNVAVFTVAVGETADSMTPWIDALEKAAKQKIDLPVLLDTEMKAAMSLGLPTVPRTIIAVDGRVVDVYGGLKPNFLDVLKKGLSEWEKKADAADAKTETLENDRDREADPSSEGSAEASNPEVNKPVVQEAGPLRICTKSLDASDR